MRRPHLPPVHPSRSATRAAPNGAAPEESVGEDPSPAELPRNFSRSLLSNYLRTAVSAIVALVMTPLLVRHLGTERYGIWVLVGSIALYLELLEFGFGTATIKYVAHYLSLNDLARVRSTISTSFWVLAVPGLVALLVGGMLTAFFPLLFHLSPGLAGPSRLLLLLVVFSLAVSIPSDTFGGLLAGLQRYDLLSVTIVATAVAEAVAWALVLWLGGGLVALGSVTVGLSLAGQLSRFLIARRLVPGAGISRRHFDRSMVRALASLSGWYAVIDLAIIVVGRIDTIVVGLVVGVPAAGVYAVGQKLAFAAEQIISPTTRSFLPYSSELGARNDVAGLRTAIVTGTRISFAVAGPLCLALAFLAAPALRAWVGNGFDGASKVVVFLVASTAIASLSRTGFLMLQGIGAARVPALVLGGEAILNLILSVVLAKLFGLVGVALATLVAGAIGHVFFLIPYICRRFEISPATLLVPVARAHVPPIAAGVLVGWLLSREMGLTNLAEVAAAGAAIVGAYLLTFAFAGLDASERRRVRALIGNRRFVRAAR